MLFIEAVVSRKMLCRCLCSLVVQVFPVRCREITSVAIRYSPARQLIVVSSDVWGHADNNGELANRMKIPNISEGMKLSSLSAQNVSWHQY